MGKKGIVCQFEKLLAYRMMHSDLPSPVSHAFVCCNAWAIVSMANVIPKQTAFRLQANRSPVISHVRVAPLDDQQSLGVTQPVFNETAPQQATDNWFWSKRLCVTGNGTKSGGQDGRKDLEQIDKSSGQDIIYYSFLWADIPGICGTKSIFFLSKITGQKTFLCIVKLGEALSSLTKVTLEIFSVWHTSFIKKRG